MYMVFTVCTKYNNKQKQVVQLRSFRALVGRVVRSLLCRAPDEMGKGG